MKIIKTSWDFGPSFFVILTHLDSSFECLAFSNVVSISWRYLHGSQNCWHCVFYDLNSLMHPSLTSWNILMYRFKVLKIFAGDIFFVTCWHWWVRFHSRWHRIIPAPRCHWHRLVPAPRCHWHHWVPAPPGVIDTTKSDPAASWTLDTGGHQYHWVKGFFSLLLEGQF